ncbi:sugar ABC transporter substrate-binding protein [Patulibacter sp. SYSU D01012]|uniref:sugar ABC transporter substrate-binding protein n=1 Tax=Patulibacter sp. SYSU D01012 TaxID=2817381 RepID=UPI001B301D7F|nr:sugar ABC transporter substrate-binding protein [Patulibacter sp. SYSU D01012]
MTSRFGTIRRAALAAAAAGTLAFGATACGGSSDGGSSGGGGGEKIVIGWAPPSATGVFKTATNYFDKALAGARAAGMDVELTTRSPAAETDPQAQVSIVEDFITKKVDAIVVSPSDTQAIKPALRRANEAGIPVIMVNLLEDQPGVDVASYIGFDNAEAAEVTAYSVLDYFGGPGVLGDGEKVDVPKDKKLDLAFWRDLYKDVDKASITARGGQLQGVAGTLFAVERLKGFKTVFDQFPNAKTLGQPIAADWERQKAVGATEDLVSRFKDQMQFVWGSSSEMSIGAANVLERRGLLDASGKPEKGKIAVFSNDVTPETASLVKQGKIAAETTHGFADWGWIGAQTAVRLVCGLPVEKKNNIGPRTVYPGNVDQYFPTPEQPAIDWAAIKAECK